MFCSFASPQYVGQAPAADWSVNPFSGLMAQKNIVDRALTEVISFVEKDDFIDTGVAARR